MSKGSNKEIIPDPIYQEALKGVKAWTDGRKMYRKYVKEILAENGEEETEEEEEWNPSKR